MINLPAKQLDIVKSILLLYVPGAEVWLFGSRIAPNCKPYSDLDIIIRKFEGFNQKLLFRLMDAFEESDLPIKVDVLDWESVDEGFQKVILRNYEVLEF